MSDRLKEEKLQKRVVAEEEPPEGWTPPDVDEFYKRESERWAELLELLRKS